jgi:nitrate reductase (NAD(P)H)
MIKWLTRITISREESQSFYHYHDNRVLPSMVDQERADNEGWWRKPEYIINDLNLNSAITHPVRFRVCACLRLYAENSYTRMHLTLLLPFFTIRPTTRRSR